MQIRKASEKDFTISPKHLPYESKKDDEQSNSC